MQKNQAKRSSDSKAPMSAPSVRPRELKGFMHDLANVRDERLDWLRKKHAALLSYRYHCYELGLYRDELRLLWHPADGVPEEEWVHFQAWLRTRPTAEPGEMICNRDRKSVV